MNETGVARETEYFFRRLAEPFRAAGAEIDGLIWLAFLVPAAALAVAYALWMYSREARTVGRLWAAGLASLRVGTFLVLVLIFLLPARREWERTEKRSRVLVLVDVSPSVTDVSDDRPGDSGSDPKRSRYDKVAALLGDEDVALIRLLAAKNPVHVYRFGSRADAEPDVFTAVDEPYDAGRWRAWAEIDFKALALDGLSDAGREKAVAAPAWGPADAPGDSAWAAGWLARPDDGAVPRGLAAADAQRLARNRERLGDRLEVARQLRQGTDVPGSALDALNRESGRAVQAMVIISDGRSTRESQSAQRELRDLAGRRKVPVFTVAVGEDRPRVRVRITDVQAPSLTPPGEAFKAYVQVDGEGLPGQETVAALDLYPPGAQAPGHTLEARLTFEAGEPPHGQAEFVIDPAEMPEALLNPEPKGKGAELSEGEWRLVARVPRAEGEAFEGGEHVSDPPAKVQVIESPLRVLVFGSGPGRGFQFLKTLLAREGERAEVSIYLQNEAGRQGELVADIDPNRVLQGFPNRLDTERRDAGKPEDKFYNLAEYDVIAAFDPDWSELSREQLALLDAWMANGGGLVFLAGPVHTAKLAGPDAQALGRLPDAMPVTVGDNLLANLKRTADRPWRLTFPGASPETDFLQLDDAGEQLSGWSKFFGAGDPNPVRGFFNFYPVEPKPGAVVVARFQDPLAGAESGEPAPWMVAGTYGQGRTLFLGSEETWRLRGFKREYFERFWLKLLRYAAEGSRKKQARRGRLLMGRDFVQGDTIRVQAELKRPDLSPLPETAAPSFTIRRLGPDAEGQPERTFDLAARKSRGEWDGVFRREIPAAPAEFPAGDYRLDLPVPDSGESLSATFAVRRSDPELDETRPDLDALRRMAGTLEEVTARVGAAGTPPALAAGLGGRPQRLAFRLETDRDLIKRIPDCVTTEVKVERNRGPVEDLWDDGFALPAGLTRPFTAGTVEVSYLLLLAAALLSTEWATRKLLRLA